LPYLLSLKAHQLRLSATGNRSASKEYRETPPRCDAVMMVLLNFIVNFSAALSGSNQNAGKPIPKWD
jgi:hypothetical protein